MTQTLIRVITCCDYVYSMLAHLSTGYSSDLEQLDGNEFRDVWKASCWQMLDEVIVTSLALRPAMSYYAFISRLMTCMKRRCLLHLVEMLQRYMHAPVLLCWICSKPCWNIQVLPACQTWYDHAWAYFRTLVDSQVEKVTTSVYSPTSP